MRFELKLQRMGDSTGLLLPEEVLTRMKLRAGDTVSLRDAGDGSFFMAPTDDEASHLAAESVMRRFPNTLRELS